MECKWPKWQHRPFESPQMAAVLQNLVGKAEDQTQLLVCDGAWTEEDTFAVNLRWAETCLTKKLVFHFDCDGVTVEDTNNSAFSQKWGRPGCDCGKIE